MYETQLDIFAMIFECINGFALKVFGYISKYFIDII